MHRSITVTSYQEISSSATNDRYTFITIQQPHTKNQQQLRD